MIKVFNVMVYDFEDEYKLLDKYFEKYGKILTFDYNFYNH